MNNLNLKYKIMQFLYIFVISKKYQKIKSIIIIDKLLLFKKFNFNY